MTPPASKAQYFVTILVIVRDCNAAAYGLLARQGASVNSRVYHRRADDDYLYIK